MLSLLTFAAAAAAAAAVTRCRHEPMSLSKILLFTHSLIIIFIYYFVRIP